MSPWAAKTNLVLVGEEIGVHPDDGRGGSSPIVHGANDPRGGRHRDERLEVARLLHPRGCATRSGERQSPSSVHAHTAGGGGPHRGAIKKSSRSIKLGLPITRPLAPQSKRMAAFINEIKAVLKLLNAPKGPQDAFL